jgi:porphobilinogen synthase
MGYPLARPRRLRGSAAIRRLVTQTSLRPGQLVQPLFVREGASEPTPVASMPGVVQHTLASLPRAVERAAAAGVGAVMLFGIPARRDPAGSGGVDPDGVLNAAIRDVTALVGDELVVMADLCLDEFTDHGHCGLLAPDGTVDNDATLAAYAKMALAQADAGAHVVAPSGMMDGQVGAVRQALEAAGHVDVGIVAYAAKFASVFYGPFREAVDSALVGDRRTYQLDPANRADALRELKLDVEEGADIVLVKPAAGYLDVVRAAREAVDIPVGAYQVSGEYAMVEAAAARGWIDREGAIVETLTSIRRAGADIVVTYWASEVAAILDTTRASG